MGRIGHYGQYTRGGSKPNKNYRPHYTSNDNSIQTHVEAHCFFEMVKRGVISIAEARHTIVMKESERDELMCNKDVLMLPGEIEKLYLQRKETLRIFDMLIFPPVSPMRRRKNHQPTWQRQDGT
jgi:hypothetical protein